MKNQRNVPVLIFAAFIIAAAASASQGVILGKDPWWYAGVFWPNFLTFLIPSILAVALVEMCNRFFLKGEGGAFARKCTWWAFGLRITFLVVVPIAMALWGYPGDSRTHMGLVETDAINATQSAWQGAISDTSVLDNWHRVKGDNTGGITVMGVIMFRLFSSDLERSLLLGLLAAAVSSLTAIAAFRLANGLFSTTAAGIAALLAAIYPEAVMIGSMHEQQGYLALILGIFFLALAGLVLRDKPRKEEPGLPGLRASLILMVVAVAALFFISSQFASLGIVLGAIFAVWLASPREKAGRILWIVAGITVLALIVIRILGVLNIIPGRSDVLFSQYRYLYSMAWTEFDKIVAVGGGDLFQQVLLTMNRGSAFLTAAIYGLLQPVLPAAIGHRNPTAEGGVFWQVLGIYRSLGWYLLLPWLIYGGIRSLRNLLSRKPEVILAAIFWLAAFIVSYRAFGDQWDNPRYRLFALVPMVLLAGWARATERETHDAMFRWIAVPFGVAVAGLTAWYILRDYAGWNWQIIPSMAVLAGITVVAFLLTAILPRLRKTKPAA